MLTREQVADQLGMSPLSLNYWVKTGRITPAEERGYYNAVLFTESEVERAREQRAGELVADLEKLGYTVTLMRKQ